MLIIKRVCRERTTMLLHTAVPSRIQTLILHAELVTIELDVHCFPKAPEEPAAFRFESPITQSRLRLASHSTSRLYSGMDDGLRTRFVASRSTLCQSE